MAISENFFPCKLIPRRIFSNNINPTKLYYKKNCIHKNYKETGLLLSSVSFKSYMAGRKCLKFLPGESPIYPAFLGGSDTYPTFRGLLKIKTPSLYYLHSTAYGSFPPHFGSLLESSLWVSRLSRILLSYLFSLGINNAWHMYVHTCAHAHTHAHACMHSQSQWLNSNCLLFF